MKMQSVANGKERANQSVSAHHVSESSGTEEILIGYQTEKAQRNFDGMTGLSPIQVYPEIVKSIALIKAAAARANLKLGTFKEIVLGNGCHVTPTMISNCIEAASKEVATGLWNHQFTIDVLQGGAGTSLHMNANEVIASRANQLLGRLMRIPLERTGALTYPIHPNDHVNAGQSTNDVIPTALRLGMLIRNSQLRDALGGLIDAFIEKTEAVEFNNSLQVGRTHLQDAVPIRPSQVMAGYGAALIHSAAALDGAVHPLSQITLGATAIGTGIDTAPGYRQLIVQELRETLREFRIAISITESGDYLSTTNSMGAVLGYSSALRNLSTELTRIASDIRLLVSGPVAGIGEYKIPELQPGSSIMPGKSNPVIPELVNQACFIVIGNDLCINLAAQNGQLQLNVMAPVVAYKMMESMHVITAAMEKFKTFCIEPLSLNKETMRNHLRLSYCGILALKPIVGYEAASAIAKAQIARKIPLEDLIADESFLQSIGVQATVRELLDSLSRANDLTGENAMGLAYEQ